MGYSSPGLTCSSRFMASSIRAMTARATAPNRRGAATVGEPMPGPVDQDGRRGLLGLDYGRRPWSVWAEALRGWRAVTEPLRRALG